MGHFSIVPPVGGGNENIKNGYKEHSCNVLLSLRVVTMNCDVCHNKSTIIPSSKVKKNKDWKNRETDYRYKLM